MIGLGKTWQTCLVVGIFSLFTAKLSHADTYNFFFKDKAKKGKKLADAENPDVSVSSDGEESSRVKPRAIKPLTSPAEGEDVLEAAPPTSQLPPIIINNTNHLQPLPPVQALQAENSAANIASDVETLISPPKSKRPSPWRLGGSFNIYNQDPGRGVDEYKSENFGGTLSLAHCKDRGIAFNFFAGGRGSKVYHNVQLHYGMDVELMPIRSHASEFEIPAFEAGVILGVSTLSAHPDNWFSGHTGFRTNFNFSDTFGITLMGRANLGYVMGEAGIMTRI